jgi:hypothetical protein
VDCVYVAGLGFLDEPASLTRHDGGVVVVHGVDLSIPRPRAAASKRSLVTY